ncbi:MAG TPA: FmdB family zinc ribbon protein [Mycobacteriales bacterium]|nr:FmdB family zinc ribbon protein [Mycobacteriales bacterium]
MPTYQYRCTNGHEIEAVQSFTDDPLTVCPECGGALRKTYGSVGVVFKGSGFYRNDSRSDGKQPASAKAAGASKAESSGSGTSSGEGSASGGSAPKESSSTSGAAAPKPSSTANSGSAA